MPVKKKPPAVSKKKSASTSKPKPLSPDDLYKAALTEIRGLAPDMPDAPSWIGKWGRLEWYELGQCLHNEKLFRGHMDYSLFAKYCNQHDTYVEVCRAIAREGKILVDPEGESGYGEPNPKLKMVDLLLKNIMAMINRFGVTPMSRNSMDISDAPQYNKLKAELGTSNPVLPFKANCYKPKGF